MYNPFNFFTDAIVRAQCDAMESTNKLLQEQAEDMKHKLGLLSSKEVVNEFLLSL